MAVRSYPIRHPLDLRLTLAPLATGPYDPTIRLATGRAWWATRTPDGPATVALVHAGDVLRAEAWGPGADRALADIPSLLGLDRRARPDPDRPSADRPARPPRHRASASRGRRPCSSRSSRPSSNRRSPATRRTGRTIGLIRVHGEAAPGPAEWRSPAPAHAGDAGRAPLLRLPPVRHRAAPGRAHPARRVTGVVVRGDRRPATPRGVRAADGRARGSGRGPRPRSASGRWATPTR